jgi:hypothetical protein
MGIFCNMLQLVLVGAALTQLANRLLPLFAASATIASASRRAPAATTAADSAAAAAMATTAAATAAADVDACSATTNPAPAGRDAAPPESGSSCWSFCWSVVTIVVVAVQRDGIEHAAAAAAADAPAWVQRIGTAATLLFDPSERCAAAVGRRLWAAPETTALVWPFLCDGAHFRLLAARTIRCSVARSPSARALFITRLAFLAAAALHCCTALASGVRLA